MTSQYFQPEPRMLSLALNKISLYHTYIHMLYTRFWSSLTSSRKRCEDECYTHFFFINIGLIYKSSATILTVLIIIIRVHPLLWSSLLQSSIPDESFFLFIIRTELKNYGMLFVCLFWVGRIPPMLKATGKLFNGSTPALEFTWHTLPALNFLFFYFWRFLKC